MVASIASTGLTPFIHACAYICQANDISKLRKVYELVVVALRASVGMDMLVEGNRDWKLPRDAAEEYENLGFIYASVCCRLSQRCQDAGKTLFNVTINFFICYATWLWKHGLFIPACLGIM